MADKPESGGSKREPISWERTVEIRKRLGWPDDSSLVRPLPDKIPEPFYEDDDDPGEG